MDTNNRREKNYTREFIKEKYKIEYNKNGRLADSIDDMINNFDFRNLNEVVKSGVEFAFGENNRRKAMDTVQNLSESMAGYLNNIKDKSINITTKGYSIEKYSNKPRGFVQNLIMQLVSYPMGLGMLMLGGVMQLFNATPFLAYLLSGVLFALGALGTYKTIVISRYRKYLKFLENREYSRIQDMSKFLNIGVSTIIKDINKMIGMNVLTEAHLVEDDSLLLVTKKSYMEYEENRKSTLAEEKEKEKLLNNKELNDFVESTSTSLEDMNKIISQIDDNSVKTIAKKINKTIVDIVEVVKKYPENLSMLDRFSSYYLPTTIKLLISFEELEENNDSISSAVESREEIKKALDTILNAYTRLLNQLISVKSMDINADISVLNTMLSQDGLK